MVVILLFMFMIEKYRRGVFRACIFIMENQ